MKFQVPLTIGVFVAGFAAVGCDVSDAEIPDRDFWTDAAVGGDDASVAVDSGREDSAVYDNDASVQAGAGGGGPQAGSGGVGGSPVAGAGGSGGSLAQGGKGGTGGKPPAGGTGGAGGSIAQGGSGGDGNEEEEGCPAEYTMATHVVINVSWDSTTAVAKSTGTNQVHIWTKSKFTDNGDDTADVVSRSCGSVMPTIIPSAIAQSFTGTKKILPEIPNSAWESESMPTFAGTATRNGNTVTMSPGPALVGLTMDNPTGTWPSVGNIMGVDHDGDGKLGLTAIPKTNDGYSAIPVELSLNPKRADKIYLAIRNAMTLTTSYEGCTPDTVTGTANVTKFDNHVIGCHVQGGGECTTKQRNFVDENTTVYKIGSATFTSVKIDENATCADVRAALP